MNAVVFCISIIIAVVSLGIILYCIRQITKEKKKPYSTIALFTFLLVIAIPFIINESYKGKNGYATLWGADDLFLFYGTLLGAASTIAAVVLTIAYTNRQNQKALQNQKQLILDELNKNELIKKNDIIIDYSKKITSILLLENFEVTSFFNALSQNTRIYESFKEIPNIYYYIEKLEVSDSEQEINYISKVYEIIQTIKEILSPLSNKVKEAEENIKIYQEKKMSFDNAMKEYSKSAEYQIRRINDLHRGVKSKITEFDESKPNGPNDIWLEYKNMLLSYRDDYKNEYDIVYTDFLEYRRDKLKTEIEFLYNSPN